MTSNRLIQTMARKKNVYRRANSSLILNIVLRKTKLWKKNSWERPNSLDWYNSNNLPTKIHQTKRTDLNQSMSLVGFVVSLTHYQLPVSLLFRNCWISTDVFYVLVSFFYCIPNIWYCLQIIRSTSRIIMVDTKLTFHHDLQEMHINIHVF